ncbi:MAG: cardiolipin synthase [Bacteroidales bacterium]|nr:cardiolipin synthase [Bacteroidales bacterium]
MNIFLAVLLVSVIVLEIAENGRPIHTLAWILVLTFLPGIGLVLYFFFGRDRKNRRMLSAEDTERLQEKVSQACGTSVPAELPESRKNLITLLYTAGRALPVEGNDVKVYTDFSSMYTDLLSDLESARHHIHFQFFKFEDDEMGRKAEEILARKAEEGVEVRLQIDDLANYTRRRFYRRMERRGVIVEPFFRVRLLMLSSDTNYRNHRKNVVIDGRVGYTGGMNIAKRYATGSRIGVWRDTHIRVTGPVVAEMQAAFLTDWKFSTKQLLDDPVYYPEAPKTGNLLMQVVTSGPMGEFRVIMQGLIRIITESKRYVYIQSPYFIPNDALMLALRNAALSGVDVRLMTPYKGDKGVITPLASRSYVKDLLLAGVKVCFYDKGFLHAKTIVADDEVFSVGSTNLDIRSFEQDFEINAFIYDRDLACRMREVFEKDEPDGHYVELEEWSNRPALTRFTESVARLFSPLL